MEGKMKVRTYKVLFLYNIITRWILTYLFFFNRAEALIGSGGKKLASFLLIVMIGGIIKTLFL